MEAHSDDDAKVSNSAVNRIERGVKVGKTRDELLPNLAGVGADISGDGLTVQVRFSRTEGLPVRYVTGVDANEATAIEEVDLQRKYHWTPSGLAQKLKVDTTRAKLLREHLGIDPNGADSHDFKFNKTRHRGFSDNALTHIDAIVESHSKINRKAPRPACMQPGCATVAAAEARQSVVS